MTGYGITDAEARMKNRRQTMIKLIEKRVKHDRPFQLCWKLYRLLWIVCDSSLFLFQMAIKMRSTAFDVFWSDFLYLPIFCAWTMIAISFKKPQGSTIHPDVDGVSQTAINWRCALKEKPFPPLCLLPSYAMHPLISWGRLKSHVTLSLRFRPRKLHVAGG